MKLLQARLDYFPIFLGVTGLGQSPFRFAAQDGDRGAQLVREIGGKLRQPSKRIFEAGQHLVEADGERLDFIGPAGDGDAFVQMGRANAFHRLGQVLERAQTAPGHERSNAGTGQDSTTEHAGEQRRVMRGKPLVVRPILRQLQRQAFVPDFGDSRDKGEEFAGLSSVVQRRRPFSSHGNSRREHLARKCHAHLRALRDDMAGSVHHPHRVSLVGRPDDL